MGIYTRRAFIIHYTGKNKRERKRTKKRQRKKEGKKSDRHMHRTFTKKNEHTEPVTFYFDNYNDLHECNLFTYSLNGKTLN